MSRVSWVFGGYEWPINPNKDSGWIKEAIIPEHNNVASTQSTFHFTATKSARRRISGWIWGEGSGALYVNLRNWDASKARAVLKDHTGEERRCFLMSFEAEPVFDVAEWREGRQTYTYTAEFVESV